MRICLKFKEKGGKLSATVQKRKRETEQKRTKKLEGEVAENGGPNAVGSAVKDPEFGVRVEEDGDVFFGGGSDLEGFSVELDGAVVVDFAGSAEGKMEVEEGGCYAPR
jgi:hypothetical protein